MKNGLELWNVNITASHESLLVHILPLEISNCYSENYRDGPEEVLIWPQHQGLSMQLSSVPFVVAATLRLATTVGDSLEILVPMETARRGSVRNLRPRLFSQKIPKRYIECILSPRSETCSDSTVNSYEERLQIVEGHPTGSSYDLVLPALSRSL